MKINTVNILLFITLLTTFGCTSEVDLELLAKENEAIPSRSLSLSLLDKFSGLEETTYSAEIQIAIESDLKIEKWCLVETSIDDNLPPIPSEDDSCFKNSKPTTHTLTTIGKRVIHLFVKEKDEEVSTVDISKIITFANNKAPDLVLDNISALAGTPVEINPLANDIDEQGDTLIITAVGVPGSGTANLNADGTITFTASGGFVGETSFSYTVEDSRGDTSTGQVYMAVKNAFTWIGNGGDSNWSNAANWCGSLVGTDCQNDGAVPGVADLVYINSSCINCNITIDAPISIDGINIGEGYSGVLTQSAGQTITVGDLDWIQNGGTFVGGDSEILINRGEFVLNGGSFTSTTADLNILDIKGGYATHSYFTISASNLFHHNNGRVWFNLRSNNHPIHTINITGVNPFYDVLVKRDGSGTDDVILTTAFSPDNMVIERNLNLESITIKGRWELQGDIYYGADYGDYQGLQDANIVFSGANNQSLTVDGASGFSKGDVVINKTGGVVTLGSNIILNTAGQDLDIQSDTLVNMTGFDLDINSNLNLATGSTLNRAGGVLSYGTWNAQGTINP